MRDQARVRDLNNVAPDIPTTHSTSSETPAPSEVESDGLLVDEAVVDHVIERVISVVSESLSSECVEEEVSEAIEKKAQELQLRNAKHASEIEGLRNLFTYY